MTSVSSPSILQMSGITKHFGPTIALDNVDFDLRRGEVKAILGENGAGKSTLVKILSGALKPDKGRMELDGLIFEPSGPTESQKRGISMIYQELNLAPHLTVEENIMLGREKHRGGFLRQKDMRGRVLEALKFLQHPDIKPDTPVKRLSIGARQIVEIARALVDEALILIMDEPTSSLSHEDNERLFEVIGKLKSQGVSIIYISHFLEEVKEVADSFAVLRDGRNIESGSMTDVSLDQIIQMMVGKKVTEMYPSIEHQKGEEILRVQDLHGRKMKEGASFSVHRGEILGMAGLIGSGRTETLRSIFGLDKIQGGTLSVDGKNVTRGDPMNRIQQGMGLLSEDRQGEGLAVSLSVKDNLTLSCYSPYTSSGFLNLKKQKKVVVEYCRLMNIKMNDVDQPVDTLSGGNQQKVAMARLLHQKADILLLDEPTRGIDVLSKSQMYEWMGKLASEGKAIVFVSSYIPELLGICDRIAVFYRGRIVEVRPTDLWTMEDITASTTVGRSENLSEEHTRHD